jgi:hypothetical protein
MLGFGNEFTVAPSSPRALPILKQNGESLAISHD